jgi:hypothetical protein
MQILTSALGRFFGALKKKLTSKQIYLKLQGGLYEAK